MRNKQITQATYKLDVRKWELRLRRHEKIYWAKWVIIISYL